jgi:hypothetical protein
MGTSRVHDVDGTATSPIGRDSGGECTPTVAKNRETERSNRVSALMKGRYHEQVPTGSSTTEGLSKKQMPLGKREDKLTWTQLYGR